MLFLTLLIIISTMARLCTSNLLNMWSVTSTKASNDDYLIWNIAIENTTHAPHTLECNCPPSEDCIIEFKLNDDMIDFLKSQGLITQDDLKKLEKKLKQMEIDNKIEDNFEDKLLDLAISSKDVKCTAKLKEESKPIKEDTEFILNAKDLVQLIRLLEEENSVKPKVLQLIEDENFLKPKSSNKLNEDNFLEPKAFRLFDDDNLLKSKENKLLEDDNYFKPKVLKPFDEHSYFKPRALRHIDEESYMKSKALRPFDQDSDLKPKPPKNMNVDNFLSLQLPRIINYERNLGPNAPTSITNDIQKPTTPTAKKIDNLNPQSLRTLKDLCNPSNWYPQDIPKYCYQKDKKKKKALRDAGMKKDEGNGRRLPPMAYPVPVPIPQPMPMMPPPMPLMPMMPMMPAPMAPFMPFG